MDTYDYVTKLKVKQVFGKPLLFDPDTCDLLVIGEQTGYAKLFDGYLDIDNANVVDIGGNRGYFASYAFSRGVKDVTSVEPDPTNAAVYRENAPRAELLEAGAGTSTEDFTLYVNLGKNKGLHSTVPIRGRDQVTVKQINFWDLIDHQKPDLVKIDCEGAGYFLGLADRDFPPCVKRIAVELDINKFVNKTIQQLIKSGEHDNPMVQENVFYKTYQHIKRQFPTTFKDTSQNLRQLNWNVTYIGAR